MYNQDLIVNSLNYYLITEYRVSVWVPRKSAYKLLPNLYIRDKNGWMRHLYAQLQHQFTSGLGKGYRECRYIYIYSIITVRNFRYL